LNTGEALRLLSKHHLEYIKMAKAIAGNNREVRNYAEDFVQDAYLRLSKYDDLYDKIVKNGKVSKGYMFFTLRSVILNKIKKKSNLDYDYIGDDYDFEEVYNIIDSGIDLESVAREALEIKMYNVLKENSNWWDYKLFVKYVESGKSFRRLSEESGIGVRTIYLSIKRSKIVIAEHLYEDYLDFVNGDFDRI
jgi:hypothetical protein